jgi:hypothetical protein
MKTKQCKATTKKGRRCTKRVPASDNRGLCAVHEKRSKSAKWKTLKSAFTKATVALTVSHTILQEAGRVQEIYRFLIDHWPKISHLFHSISHGFERFQCIQCFQCPESHDTSLRRRDLWVNHTRDTIESFDEEEAKKLVADFKDEFVQLPPEVQGMITSEFGKETIDELTK